MATASDSPRCWTPAHLVGSIALVAVSLLVATATVGGPLPSGSAELTTSQPTTGARTRSGIIGPAESCIGPAHAWATTPASGTEVDWSTNARVVSAQAVAATTVRVFVHVIAPPTEAAVSRSRIRRQIDVLNRAYAGRQSSLSAVAPFRFALEHVDVTVSRQWSRMTEGSVAERHAKRQLHRGGERDLNLYLVRGSSDTLGWATQANQVSSAPLMDGVAIAVSTMPGGRGGHYSAGDAAVHESGHWLGLLHTFAGSCGAGDQVTDTAPEGRPSYTCPAHRDSCPAPGDDPIHNFMDYSYDSCMNQFTPGQVSRMRRSWQRFRVEARREVVA